MSRGGPSHDGRPCRASGRDAPFLRPPAHRYATPSHLLTFLVASRSDLNPTLSSRPCGRPNRPVHGPFCREGSALPVPKHPRPRPARPPRRSRRRALAAARAAARLKLGDERAAVGAERGRDDVASQQVARAVHTQRVSARLGLQEGGGGRVHSHRVSLRGTASRRAYRRRTIQDGACSLCTPPVTLGAVRLTLIHLFSTCRLSSHHNMH